MEYTERELAKIRGPVLPIHMVSHRKWFREPGLVAIVSPMVGTFYTAPAPGAKPYVSEGERIGVGQVVCIVEAMKLMNEVQSEVAGAIRKICVENGQAVEYGTELFLVASA